MAVVIFFNYFFIYFSSSSSASIVADAVNNIVSFHVQKTVKMLHSQNEPKTIAARLEGYSGDFRQLCVSHHIKAAATPPCPTVHPVQVEIYAGNRRFSPVTKCQLNQFKCQLRRMKLSAAFLLGVATLVSCAPQGMCVSFACKRRRHTGHWVTM